MTIGVHLVMVDYLIVTISVHIVTIDYLTITKSNERTTKCPLLLVTIFYVCHKKKKPYGHDHLENCDQYLYLLLL